MAHGRFGRLALGASPSVMAAAGSGVNSVTATALNFGVCYRFTALDSRDIGSVVLYYASVSGGTQQLRIETIDATTGKPTGTLYDVNAVKTFNPNQNYCVVTFDTLPTTGLTPGTNYGIVILTTVAGTTISLGVGANNNTGYYPGNVLTATDGTTRSNFGEVSNTWAPCALIMEDGSEEQWQFMPLILAADTIYGTRAVGARFRIVTPMTIFGVETGAFTRAGSPGDLRLRLRDMGNTILAESVADKDSLGAINTKKIRMLFPSGPYRIMPGEYRILLDQADHSTTSGNNYGPPKVGWRNSAPIPKGFYFTGTTNIDASPVSWDLENNAQMPAWAILLDDIPDPRRWRHREGVS